MKKVILLGLLITLFSCKKQEETVRVLTPEQARTESIRNKINADNEIIERYYIQEFDYKGHTYMYNTVKAGISAWHAGHCKCNPNY